MATLRTGTTAVVSKYQVHRVCSRFITKASPWSVPVAEEPGRRVCEEEEKLVLERGLNSTHKPWAALCVHPPLDLLKTESGTELPGLMKAFLLCLGPRAQQKHMSRKSMISIL